MSQAEALKPYSKLFDPKRKPLVQQLPLAMPFAMYVELTNKCNFACRFCPESFSDYEEQAKGYHTLDIPAFEKICADIRAMGTLKVMRFFMMGEPLLHKDLATMIAIAKKTGTVERTELTTNGSAMTERRARELIDCGLDYIRFSIYAMDAERHRQITASKVPPEMIEKNIAALRRMRNEARSPHPYISAQMVNPFIDEEVRLFRETYGKLADECRLDEPHNWNDLDNRDLMGAVYEQDIDRDKLMAMKKEVCPFPFFTLVVYSSGDVGVCCVDWSKKALIGNIFKDSLKEIWTGPQLHAFQKMHVERRRSENEACRHCTFLHTYHESVDSIMEWK